MKLGVDSYSLLWQGWDYAQILEYCAQIGVDGVSLSERDPDRLRALKHQADELGLELRIGMDSIDKYAASFRHEFGSGESQLEQLMRNALLVDCPIVRCFMGGETERTGTVPFSQHVDECLRVLRAAAPIARDLGLKIAFENHNQIDLLARELRDLVVAAGPDVVGVCLDTGNPTYVGEDALVTTEVLAPYVLSTHVRDTRVWSVPGGAMSQWVPMGEGDIDLTSIFALLREHAPDAPIDLEIITGREPTFIPYFNSDSEYWNLFPTMLARDFARFVALAERGRAAPYSQLTVPPGGHRAAPVGREDAFRAQQRQHLEQSVKYCRNEFRMGDRAQ